MTDGFARRALGVLSWPLRRLAWSGAFISVLGAVTRRMPARTYRVRYRESYMYASSFDRYLAINLWKFGVLESYELQLIRSLITPGMQVLDIGANVGFHTLEMARATGPSGRVTAFEPEPRNFADLSRNIAASGMTHVAARQFAIGDREGSVDLLVSPAHGGDHRILAGGGHRERLPVPMTSVDALFGKAGQRVDFVKIDTQGAEHLALAGMRSVLANNPQLVMIVEFSPELLRGAGIAPDQVAALIASLGRRLRIIDHNERRCVDGGLDDLRRLAHTEKQIDVLLTPASHAT
jgi:FkbM family methyltransferase